MIDIDEMLKLTLSQGHILQQSTFGSMKMCICDKEARLTYLRGVNVLVLLGKDLKGLFCLEVMMYLAMLC